MNVHKFSVEREMPKKSKSKTVIWSLDPNLKHPPIKENPYTWNIFPQEEITLYPGQVFPMQLGVGFTLTNGVVLVSLVYSLRYKNCSLQNAISLKDASNILITITNNSKDTVIIKENELICYVYYHV